MTFKQMFEDAAFKCDIPAPMALRFVQELECLGWKIVGPEVTPKMVHEATLTVTRENGGLEYAPYQMMRVMRAASPTIDELLSADSKEACR